MLISLHHVGPVISGELDVPLVQLLEALIGAIFQIGPIRVSHRPVTDLQGITSFPDVVLHWLHPCGPLGTESVL